ncbi:facilitated trehalose transporter Tret1-like isoform X1 [Microplitis mediator]|uniref:facilitated trehalose transporter Tret1-like isoform X1 n=1 Tax=Microplitis mediator TaxID=375433 RepID=UPI002555505C|nr:facilitated trehalose transporter Tret1-like isoform X1 [Microplitis mediator]XP_057333896.1 facilitated trehalose transporter Tret1-like isoform X1 [Microplitis mediator]XP_057333897.1 facilitated trehalose transporter Tret1-like isoform X1 [Microplitis mediator]
MDQEIFHQIIIGIVCNLLIIDCGLHEGWPTVTLPKFGTEDPVTLTSNQEVLLINLLYLGVSFGALSPIFLMDRFGRKWTLLSAAVPKIFSWIAIGLANTHTTLYCARLLAGIGCGITYSVMPMYIGEISTKRTRGPLGTLQSVLINIGILFIYTIGLYVTRFTMAMMSLVLPVLFIVTFVWLPESSVYLTRKNKFISAEKTLQWSLGKKNVDVEFEEIKRIVKTENHVMARGFFSSFLKAMKSRANKRAALIMLILGSVLSLTGAGAILTYQSYISEEAGFHFGTNLGIITTGVAIVLAGIVCVSLVKTTGKRRLLLLTAPLAVLCLGTIATFFTLMTYGYDVRSVNWIPTVFVIFYVIIYGLAFNPMPLAYLGELFTFDFKVTAGICSSIYYAISTTGVIKLYQVLHDSYGTHVAFWVITLITLVLWILMYLFVLETEGMSLEEIQSALNGEYIKRKPSKRKDVTDTDAINKINLNAITTTNPTIN